MEDTCCQICDSDSICSLYQLPMVYCATCFSAKYTKQITETPLDISYASRFFMNLYQLACSTNYSSFNFQLGNTGQYSPISIINNCENDTLFIVNGISPIRKKLYQEVFNDNDTQLFFSIRGIHRLVLRSTKHLGFIKRVGSFIIFKIQDNPQHSDVIELLHEEMDVYTEHLYFSFYLGFCKAKNNIQNAIIERLIQNCNEITTFSEGTTFNFINLLDIDNITDYHISSS